MTITLTTPAAIVGPVDTPGYIVQTRADWDAPWVTRTGAVLHHVRLTSAGQDMGSAEFDLPYGEVHPTHGSSFKAVPPIELSGHWVRIVLITGAGPRQIWFGRVVTQGRNPFDPQATGLPAGRQVWTAYDLTHHMSRVAVGRSDWVVDGFARSLGWTPSFNRSGPFGTLVGNRTDGRWERSYRFGGTTTWRRLDVLEYLVDRFLDEEGSGGPRWRVGGATEWLARSAETVNVRHGMSVLDAVKEVISPALGMDWVIVPLAGSVPPEADPLDPAPIVGFELRCFALSGEGASWQGVDLPKNPDVIRLPVSDPAIDEKIIERDAGHAVGRIRVVGARIVVCCSLRGDDGDVVPGWSPGLETLYKTVVPPAGENVEADELRKADLFRPVYQRFTAPATWSHINGVASPIIRSDGTVEPGLVEPPYSTGTWQNAIRHTLSWIPLREGIRYDLSPPVDENPAGVIPDLLPPQAWLHKPETLRWVAADAVGGTVHSLTDEWGGLITIEPAHRHGYGRFDADLHDSAILPEYDPDALILTIAFEGDTRPSLTWQKGPTWSPSDGELEIVVDDAEVWYVAPFTVVGVDDLGKPITTPATPLLTRNDLPRLEATLVGAITRYGRPRNRAAVAFRGLLSWDQYVGRILAIVQAGAGEERIDGPITAIDWRMSETPRTTIRTGYAT